MKANKTLFLSLLFLASCSPSPTLTPIPDTGEIQTLVASYYTGTAAAITPTLTLTPTLMPTPTPVLPVEIGTPYPLSQSAISIQNAGQIKELARWGNGRIYSWIYSPDGKSLVGASAIGIYVYDTKTLAQTGFMASKFPVEVVGFSQDGSMLAAGTNGRTVLFWNASNGTEPLALEGHTSNIEDLAISPNGNLLASSEIQSSSIFLWDTTTGKLVKTLNGQTSFAMPLVFSQDGKLLAQGRTNNGGVFVWDVDTGNVVSTLNADSFWVTRIAFSPDGKTIAISYDNGVVHLWDVAKATSLHKLGGAGGGIYAMAFSPDGKRFSYGTIDGTVRVVDTSTWRILKTIKLDTATLFQEFFSLDGKTLAIWYNNGVGFWDSSTWELVGSLEATGSRILNAALSQDGNMVAVGFQLNKSVELRDMNTGAVLFVFDKYDRGSAISFSTDGTMLAYGSESVVRIFNTRNGELIQTLRGCGKSVRALTFSPDGKMFGCGGDYGDQGIHLWNIDSVGSWSPTAISLSSPHDDTDGGYRSLAFLPIGQLLASVSRCGTLQVWDIFEEKSLSVLLKSNCTGYYDASVVVFSPNGKILAWGSGSGTVSLWDLNSGTLIVTLFGHKTGIESLAFSPDGMVLASGSGWLGGDNAENDYTIHLWSTANGTLLNVLQGHNGYVKSLAFSPNGALLVSGSADGTIRIWGIP